MEFSIKTLSPETAKAGCVVLGIYAERELTAPARRVDQRARGALRAALADLSGKTGSTLLLRGLPQVAAERVRKTKSPYEFGPMSSRERRVLHLALRDETDLRTESTGEAGQRRVVLMPKDYTGAALSAGAGRPMGRRRR